MGDVAPATWGKQPASIPNGKRLLKLLMISGACLPAAPSILNNTEPIPRAVPLGGVRWVTRNSPTQITHVNWNYPIECARGEVLSSVGYNFESWLGFDTITYVGPVGRNFAGKLSVYRFADGRYDSIETVGVCIKNGGTAVPVRGSNHPRQINNTTTVNEEPTNGTTTMPDNSDNAGRRLRLVTANLMETSRDIVIQGRQCELRQHTKRYRVDTSRSTYGELQTAYLPCGDGWTATGVGYGWPANKPMKRYDRFTAAWTHQHPRSGISKGILQTYVDEPGLGEDPSTTVWYQGEVACIKFTCPDGGRGILRRRSPTASVSVTDKGVWYNDVSCPAGTVLASPGYSIEGVSPYMRMRVLHLDRGGSDTTGVHGKLSVLEWGRLYDDNGRGISRFTLRPICLHLA